LDLAAFASGQGLNAAHRDIKPDGTPAVTMDADRNVPNSFDENVANALNELAAMPQVQSGSYEPRLLRSPRAVQGAWLVIWLKSAGSNADLIYVIKTTFNDLPGFQQGELVTAQDFIKIWQPQVQDRLAHPPPPLPEAPSGAGG
jgi:hypothetical protein